MTTRRPNRLAALLVAAVAAATLPLYRSPVESPLLATAGRGFASATAGSLAAIGVPVRRTGAVLRHPNGFAIEVAANCTAWPHVVIFLAGLATLRLGRRRTSWQALGGVATIAVVNVARLVLVYVVGVVSPAAFEWAHRVAGEAALAGTVLGLWWWAARSPSATSDRTTNSPPEAVGEIA